jgi:hypothetical protein
VAASAQDILTFCRMHMSERDAERLVGWIAWRTGRPQALAGSGEPIERLARAVEDWIDDAQRDALMGWLRRRSEGGRPLYPR